MPHLPFSWATSATAPVSAPVNTTWAPVVEQRGGAGLLLDRVVPGVDEHDVHRALGAGLLHAAHDRVAEPELLGDRERGHVADLRVAVRLRARPGEHAGEVLEVLHRAEEVAEVLAVALVPGQVQERLVGELGGDGLHRVHVPEGRPDDEVEALAGERPEGLLGVGALGHVLDVGDVGVVHGLAHVEQALVVGLAPAAVVVGPDQDHGDVELAFHGLGDLRPRRSTRDTVRRRRLRRRRLRRRRARGCTGTCTQRQRRADQQRQDPPCPTHHRWFLLNMRDADSARRTARHAPSSAVVLGRHHRAHRRPRRPARAAAGTAPRPRAQPLCAAGLVARLSRPERRHLCPSGGARATIPDDVPTHRAARWAARHLRPPSGLPVRRRRRIRAGGVAPGVDRGRRRRALHGAPHVQGH